MVENTDAAERARRAMAGALERWQGLEPSFEEFCSHLREAAVLDQDLELRGAELYLAFACSRAQVVALRVLDQEYLARTTPVITRVSGTREFVQEVQQLMRERLFVGPHPKIAQFSGTGALGAWLRVAALRCALNLRKSTRSSEALLAEAMIDPATAEPAPDDTYREAVQTALGAAFATLSPKQRNVLRLHYLEALGIDQIGALYSAHRATAARWIALAREQVFAYVREQVQREFALSESEIQSVLLQVRSQLEISVLRLLGSGREHESAAAAEP
jgi:RNA polymerase sigma-70 factor (ECF subfamily)